ncbi:MAG: ATP-binding protein [Syntrophales bacterium]
MKPRFLQEMEEAFAVQKHVVLTLNTEDRFHFPEADIRPCNLNYFLVSYFSRQGYRIAQFAPSMGIRELTTSGTPAPSMQNLQTQSDPVQIFNGINALLRNPQEKWIILILHSERLAPPQAAGATTNRDGVSFGEILHTVGLDDNVASTPSRLALVTYTGFPEDLIARSRGYRLVEVGLPALEERQAFIRFLDNLSRAGRQEFGPCENGLDTEEFARLSSGMPLSGIESLYRAAGSSRTPVTREQIRCVKAREIRNLARDLLEVSEPQEGFAGVAGFQSVKAYFRFLLPQIREGRPGVPQAILLQGVPGCGKTHLVRALAGELGWPLLEMRNVRNPFVGQSEMNLDHVIRVVEQLQPAVLFFDEIDQSIGQRGTGSSGDSGTSERMLARIFTWLGSLHLRGKLLFVGATNRPDLLDAALLDRFGVSIPVLKPGAEEIRELVPLLLNRFSRSLADLENEEAVAILKSLSLTGRDIQEILIMAALRTDLERGGYGAAIGRDQLLHAVYDHIGREDATETAFMSLVSLSLASSQVFLPWNSFAGLRPEAEIPEALRNEGFVDERGRLDLVRLRETLADLRQRRQSERFLR